MMKRSRTDQMRGLALAIPLLVQVAPRADSLVDKLLRIDGITTNWSQKRAPDPEAEPGNVWVMELDGGTSRAMTADGGYRSPVFSPADGRLYALRGDTVIRISVQADSPLRISAPGVLKLVGFDGRAPNEMVVLLDEDRHGGALGLLSLQTGRVTVLRGQRGEERGMLSQLRSQDRDYGDVRVSVQCCNLGIAVRRSDPRARPISVNDCAACFDPAVAPDRRTIAFVKATR